MALAQAKGLDISMDQLFACPTIRALSKNLASQGNEPLSLTPLQAFSLISEADFERLPADVEDAYPISRLQGGMIFHSEYGGTAGIYHDIFSYHIKMPFDAEKISIAILRTHQL